MRFARKLFLLTLLAVSLLVPAPAAHAERTIALSAGSFRFDVSPGKGGKGEVVVMNEGDQDINVLVYVADQTVDEAGNVNFVTPNRDTLQQALTGPSSWVRMEMPERAKAIGNTPYIVLKPDEEVPVKFSFEVPPETPSGDHNTVLFFEMFSLEDSTGGMASKIYGRVGSRLKIRVKGPIIERLAAAPYWVEGFVVGDTVPFRFTMDNAGNIDKRVKATVQLLDSSEEAKHSSQVATDSAVYAGSRREFTGEMKPSRQLFGKFTARLTVEYQRETGQPGLETITKDRTVWVVPPWAAYGGIAALVALLLWLIWRMAIRSAKRKLRKQREKSMRRRAERTEPAAAESAETADHSNTA